MNKYEQRFFSKIEKTFKGLETKGKSGYVNLLDLKNKYFSQIEIYIKTEIESIINESAREELYQKLYTFFDAYLNETGTVFFANTHIHKNIYEKIYDDRNDVMLFWKTKQLYYVKSEAFYDDLQTEVGTTTFIFDASDLKHKKANEKKELVFFLTEVQKNKVKFKVRYKNNTDINRLKEILGLEKKNDIIDYLLENYDSNEKPEIIYTPTNLKRDFFTKKADLRKNIYIEPQDDALKSVKVEYSISDFDLIYKYLIGNQIIIDKDELKKAFAQYKRQKEVDYFIHKNAEAFLKEQFDIYMYNWLFNDTKSQFDEATVKRMQNIKIIAYKIIEYIARFENELKAMWEKPKFVRKANYVITIDKLSDDLISKIAEHPNLKEQINEWQELGFVDNGFKIKDIYKTEEEKELTDKYKHLPIDTKYFKDIEYEILDVFEHLDQALDGVLIKSDNWQALNTIKEKYKERIQTIYIDPPFNTGKDFEYIDRFQDSTWLTLMNDRLLLSYNFLKKEGAFWLHLDDNANTYGKILLKEIYRNISEIIFDTNATKDEETDLFGYKSFGNNFQLKHQTIFYCRKGNEYFFNKLWKPNRRETKLNIGWLDLIAKPNKENPKKIKDFDFFIEQYLDDKLKLKKIDVTNEKLFPIGDIWSDIFSFTQSEMRVSESFSFTSSQKPENLLRRIIQSSSSQKDYILDFFLGIGTTISVAHKLNRNWIGIEMGEHFNEFYLDQNGTKKIGILGRLKWTLFGDQKMIVLDLNRRPHLSKDINWKGGGFFKYYELEQYEDVLSNAIYQWHEKDSEVEKYTFMKDQKLLDAIEIDYKVKNAKLVFEKLYDDIDLAETFANLTGKSVKKISKDHCILTDHNGKNEMKIDYNNLTFENYPFVKPLIWWQSK